MVGSNIRMIQKLNCQRKLFTRLYIMVKYHSKLLHIGKVNAIKVSRFHQKFLRLSIALQKNSSKNTNNVVSI